MIEAPVMIGHDLASQRIRNSRAALGHVGAPPTRASNLKSRQKPGAVGIGEHRRPLSRDHDVSGFPPTISDRR